MTRTEFNTAVSEIELAISGLVNDGLITEAIKKTCLSIMVKDIIENNTVTADE